MRAQTKLELGFKAVDEEAPGPKWRKIYELYWPSYKAWFLSEGNQARPSYLASRKALKEQMPELIGTYERLVDLAGGGDLIARFLSLYCPAPYIGACSQVCWTKGRPALLRNYDYSVPLCEATVLRTDWNGRSVIAMSDCLWGALDGMNRAGLAVSLAFGGRRVVGAGFGIPLVLRYLLETCETVPEGVRALERIPVHMAYNVTLIDAKARALTAQVGPDRPVVISRACVATNHQGQVEWEEHARATATVERERFLLRHLETDGALEDLAERFLLPPIFLDNYELGWGTLYTAIYRLLEGELELRWPKARWVQSFRAFEERELMVAYAKRRG